MDAEGVLPWELELALMVLGWPSMSWSVEAGHSLSDEGPGEAEAAAVGLGDAGVVKETALRPQRYVSRNQARRIPALTALLVPTL